MWKYILKRILMVIPVLICVTFLVYLMMRWAPGDPNKAALVGVTDPVEIEEIREANGLNDPIIVQYGRSMYNLFFGEKDRVRVQVLGRLPYTLKLAATAIIVAVALALPLGIFAAIHQNSLFDGFSMFVSLIGVSAPNFWLGMLIILFFGLKLGWFPTSGSQGLETLVMPAFTLGFCNMGFISRISRSSMLEVIRQDYIRTVQAKGMPHGMMIRKHALPNALIPIITSAGVQLCELISGAIMVEYIFAWPGIGRLLVDAIQSREIPMILGCVIAFAVCFSLVNLLVDILYVFFDPRIKSQFI